MSKQIWFIHQLQLEGRDTQLVVHTQANDEVEKKIGRTTDQDLFFGNRYLGVEPLHALWQMKGGESFIVDAGEEPHLKGVYVNGQRITAATKLKLNDRIRIGQFTLVYTVQQEEREEVVEVLPPAAPQTTPAESTPEDQTPALVNEAPPLKSGRVGGKDGGGNGSGRGGNGLNGHKNGHEEWPYGYPGLTYNTSKYMQYLPSIYHVDIGEDETKAIMPRLLAMFESLWAPIHTIIDNFDLYLDADVTREDMLNWLAAWFDWEFDASWDVPRRRQVLEEAYYLYRFRGTPHGLGRLLDIYFGLGGEDGRKVLIEDGLEQPDFHFNVVIPLPEEEVNKQTLHKLIRVNKPAHTTYEVRFGA